LLAALGITSEPPDELDELELDEELLLELDDEELLLDEELLDELDDELLITPLQLGSAKLPSWLPWKPNEVD
jgi:hypothetical protein